MAEELFDVVDVNDEVIRVAGRREVHDNKLFHRSAHVLVYDEAGRLLVQRRGFNKECSPGLWDTSAGGHVSSGEDYKTAAERELTEELGLKSRRPIEYLLKMPADRNTGQEFVGVFSAVTDEVPVLQVSEVAAARWLEIGELKAWIKRDRSQFTTVFLKICTEVGLI